MLKIQFDVHMDMPIYTFMFYTQIHIQYLVTNYFQQFIVYELLNKKYLLNYSEKLINLIINYNEL